MTTTGFSHDHTGLLCDGVSVAAIAEAVGTPVYVNSAPHLRERFLALDRAFGGYPHALHYALKANSLFGIVGLIRTLGGAADANSIWEIEVARRAGFAPNEIVFTGVGKSGDELEQAVPMGLKAINVESAGELARIEAIAARLCVRARVAVRVNPDIDAKSHPHISTGLKINKFGVPLDEARGLFATLRDRPHLQLVAVHVHIGSQITSLDPLRNAARFIARMSAQLKEAGVSLEYLDIGGGLGISYDGATVVSPSDYVGALLEEVRSTGLPIVIEPGRSIVGPAASLVARVIDIKPRNALSEFVVIDAGMTELMRPALYGAFHRIEVVRPHGGTAKHYEIVGPVCESSDVVGRDRLLPPLAVGDLVAIRDAGAYGSAMASNYNRRPLPPEVMVETDGWRIVRRRQTVDDMLALEL
ncbi:MAG: diaminopimelate decarboxylase [Vicinamibacterales bacterium]